MFENKQVEDIRHEIAGRQKELPARLSADRLVRGHRIQVAS